MPKIGRDWYMYLIVAASVLGPVGVGLSIFGTGISRLCGVSLLVISLGCIVAHSYAEDQAGKDLTAGYRKKKRGENRDSEYPE